ncbi:hypothetical protein Fmac_010470 [Flemingia macrophylla]|uniref:Polygalacturonase n=1 Tax=Flemingia macrophylla TaxID=520843 RepID=A0ABD1MJP3_9FABA
MDKGKRLASPDKGSSDESTGPYKRKIFSLENPINPQLNISDSESRIKLPSPELFPVLNFGMQKLPVLPPQDHRQYKPLDNCPVTLEQQVLLTALRRASTHKAKHNALCALNWHFSAQQNDHQEISNLQHQVSYYKNLTHQPQTKLHKPPELQINTMSIEQLSSFVLLKYWVRQYILNRFPEDIKKHIITLAQQANWNKVMTMIHRIQHLELEILPFTVLQYSENYSITEGTPYDLFPPRLCFETLHNLDETFLAQTYFCGLLHMFKMKKGTQPPQMLGPKVCNIIQTFINQEENMCIRHGGIKPYFPSYLRVYVYSSYPHVDIKGEFHPAKHHLVISYDIRLQSPRFWALSELMLYTHDYTLLTTSQTFDKTGMDFYQTFPYDLNHPLQLLGETQLCKVWCPRKRASTLWYEPILHPQLYKNDLCFSRIHSLLKKPLSTGLLLEPSASLNYENRNKAMFLLQETSGNNMEEIIKYLYPEKPTTEDSSDDDKTDEEVVITHKRDRTSLYRYRRLDDFHPPDNQYEIINLISEQTDNQGIPLLTKASPSGKGYTYFVLLSGPHKGTFTNFADLCMAKEGLANPRYKGFYTKEEADKALELDTIDPKVIHEALSPKPEIVVINLDGQGPRKSYKDFVTEKTPQDLEFTKFLTLQKFFSKVHKDPNTVPGLYIKIHPYFNKRFVCHKTSQYCPPSHEGKNCPCKLKFLFRKARIDLDQFKPLIYEDIPINLKTFLDYGCLESVLIPPSDRFGYFLPSINEAINLIQANNKLVQYFQKEKKNKDIYEASGCYGQGTPHDSSTPHESSMSETSESHIEDLEDILSHTKGYKPIHGGINVIKLICAIILVTMVSLEAGESRKAKIVRTSFEYNAINCRAHSASLTDFGGVGDGKTSNTKAFESAISHLSRYASNGGAQLYVPVGKWLTGSFSICSHFTLYLNKDAILLASQVSISLLFISFDD